jgi:hypothetical protein
MLSETLLRIPFSGIGRCSSLATSYWLQGKCERISTLNAASALILQNRRLLPVSIFSVKIAALGSLKWVTGMIFLLVNNLKGASKIMSMIFSLPKNQKFVKTISMYRKYLSDSYPAFFLLIATTSNKNF